MIEKSLNQQGTLLINLLLSKVSSETLALMTDIDCWVQVACPRLSVGWGYAFPKPLLTSYGALIALCTRERWDTVIKACYSMGLEGLLQLMFLGLILLKESAGLGNNIF